MTQSKEVIQHWIDELGEVMHRLSKWEAYFVESLAEQFDERHSLSDRQEEILERIYAEKT